MSLRRSVAGYLIESQRNNSVLYIIKYSNSIKNTSRAGKHYIHDLHHSIMVFVTDITLSPGQHPSEKNTVVTGRLKVADQSPGIKLQDEQNSAGRERRPREPLIHVSSWRIRVVREIPIFNLLWSRDLTYQSAPRKRVQIFRD